MLTIWKKFSWNATGVAIAFSPFRPRRLHILHFLIERFPVKIFYI